MLVRKYGLFFCLLFGITVVPSSALAKITTPKEHFGHEVGADYVLITYTQMVDYWKKLDQESDRMKLVDIGKTTEGRTMWMAVITSPRNHGRLARYQEISKNMALAEGMTEQQARAMAKEGKAVVWIDGGTHSAEIVNHQTNIQLAYEMVSRNDDEVNRILENVILLTLVTNPDGMDFVAEWYNGDPKTRSPWELPDLFHKYIGGDTNRDHFMSNQIETENINRVLYREWFPQIVYNQHQTGPDGEVLFVPPFREPFNYDYDPLVVMGIDLVSAAIHNRYIAEDKPGAGMRGEASYSTWWNGCLRCGTYFHNAIGILTEINGSPTPMQITFVPEKHLPDNDYPYPIAPQEWHFRQAIDYILSANYAILDMASRMSDTFLYNRYIMGRNSIEKGRKDYWTMSPSRIEAVMKAMEKDGAKRQQYASGDWGYPPEYYEKVLHDPAYRDARGYIVPSDQPDFLTATKFVNVLIKNGISVHQATESFQVAGNNYPAGSYVFKTDQAFRPHLRSMFEPQDHPDDFAYPGGPPKPPYDAAGWTLAYTMGVDFDSVYDGFDGPFQKIQGFAKPPAGEVKNPNAPGFLLNNQVNDAFIAVNRLLKDGENVYWLQEEVGSSPVGTIYIEAGPSTAPKLQEMAKELGLTFEGVSAKPSGKALKLKPARIGLSDRYGGMSTSGWTRWLLEQFEFPLEVVYPQTLNAGNLNGKYDVLIFESGAITLETDRAGMVREPTPQPDPVSLPEKYRGRLGQITKEETLPQLKTFVASGGSVLAMGSSATVGYDFGLPLADALVDPSTGKKLAMEKYWAPGSIYQVAVDNTTPLGYGLPGKLDIYFDRNPVFKVSPHADQQGVRTVAWFDSDKTLRSGWALGEAYHKGGAAVIQADVGKGKLLLLAPLVNFRGQTHSAFKLLFNGILCAVAEPVDF